MGSPTETEIRNQIIYAIDILEEVRKFGHVNAANYIAMEDTLVQALEGDYAAECMAALAGIRSGLGGLMAAGRRLLAPLWVAMGKLKGYPEEDDVSIIRRYYETMHAAGHSINSREFTFGAAAAGGGNVGNGTVNICNVDELGYEIENQTPEVKTLECVEDEHSGGREHEEIFEVRGKHFDRDRIQVTGSKAFERVTALSSRTSERILQNPSFSTLGGGTIAVPTSITGWTPTTAIGNFALVEGAANIYRKHNKETTPRSLKISANDSIYQNLSTMRVTVKPSVPMYLQIAFNREVGSGDGTLTLYLGSQSASVVLAAQAGWNVLRIAVGQDNWFRHWNQEDPLVKIGLASRTTGYVLVDDVVFAPYSWVDGKWLAIVGGSTPFLRKDVFTITDSIAADSIIQHWIWRTTGLYLPHVAGGAETWVDP